MINNKCNNIHKYGPFKKNNEIFFRICLKCNKKTTYPISNEIENEYNNQKITNYIIEIIATKKINKIQDSNYFFKLVASLLDNISYIYLTENNQKKLLDSLKELNKYFNKQNIKRHELINETTKYLKKYLINYNNEIINKYNEKVLELLDNEFIILQSKMNLELNYITSNEEKTTVTINNKYQEIDNNININFNELENESE